MRVQNKVLNLVIQLTKNENTLSVLRYSYHPTPKNPTHQPPPPKKKAKKKKKKQKKNTFKFMGRVCFNVEKRHLKTGYYQKKE